nr:unnamed protein product [Callosobruchus analis]
MKFQAYNQLLEIIRKVERDTTVDNVKKKINSLRAGYRKEHKKVRDSMRTGSGTHTFRFCLFFECLKCNMI